MKVRHINGASKTGRMLQMRKIWGDRGYGWYWIIRETIAARNPPKLPLTELVITMLNTDATPEDYSKFVDCCIKLKLFQSDGDFIWDRQEFKDRVKSRKAYYRKLSRHALREGKTEEALRIQEYANVCDAHILDKQVQDNALLRETLKGE